MTREQALRLMLDGGQVEHPDYPGILFVYQNTPRTTQPIRAIDKPDYVGKRTKTDDVAAYDLFFTKWIQWQVRRNNE